MRVHVLPKSVVAVDVRRHVAEGVAVERGVRRRRRRSGSPRPSDTHDAFGRPGDVAGDVRPGLAAVARQLQVAVVGADPDHLRVLRRLADRVDRRVHLGRRVVDRDAARLLLLLLLRVVRRQVGRDALPRLAAVARAEEELRADVERALLRRAEVDRRVPVEAQLLSCSRPSAGCRARRAVLRFTRPM